MMKQARDMQKKIAAIQEELEQQRTEASSGGGIVKATIIGTSRIEELKINPEAFDKDDIEMLQDLIIAAVNEAFLQASNKAQEQLGIFGAMP